MDASALREVRGVSPEKTVILILSGHKKRSVWPPKSRDSKAHDSDAQESFAESCCAMRFIAHSLQLAQKGRQRGLFTASAGEIGADCRRHRYGSASAPNQSASSTRKPRLIPFEKPLKNA